MSFLRRIWNTFFPKTVSDPEFGTLTLDWMYDISIDDPKPPQGLWQGRADFAPLGHSIMVVFVMESDLGSTPFQRELYHSVEARWDSIRDELARRLLELIHEWYGEAAQDGTPSTEQFFQNWIRLNGVDIRNSSPREPQWADAVLDFSVLPAALKDPSLLKMQDHNPVARLVDGEVVSVAMM